MFFRDKRSSLFQLSWRKLFTTSVSSERVGSLALLTNIRLFRKKISVKNTLAYFGKDEEKSLPQELVTYHESMSSKRVSPRVGSSFALKY